MAEIRTAAAAENMSMSELVRRAIRALLDQKATA
jgi:Arc/MetJ-type ribon-helix-helix transcriptional regulator